MPERAIPRHIGIIMDGNGRWAEARGLQRVEGHKRGVQRVTEIVSACASIGVEVLTLYAFSVENWKRPKTEISVIMDLLDMALKKEFQTFITNNIRFKVIGDISLLSAPIRALIHSLQDATASNTKMLLQVAISYGGRDEILRAVKKAISSDIKAQDINEQTFSALLDTADACDPDLIIRTSGEMRLSNFLIWQSAYSELYFTNTLWPDFSKEELLEAINEYQRRSRRFGKVEQTSMWSL